MEILVGYIHKAVTEDNYEDGEIPNTRQTLMSEEINKKFTSFEDLVEYLFLTYDLPDDPKDYIAFEDGRIVASRMEDERGDVITADSPEWADFSDGLINLWAADFDVHVELIETRIPTVNEMSSTFGIDAY